MHDLFLCDPDTSIQLRRYCSIKPQSPHARHTIAPSQDSHQDIHEETIGHLSHARIPHLAGKVNRKYGKCSEEGKKAALPSEEAAESLTGRRDAKDQRRQGAQILGRSLDGNDMPSINEWKMRKMVD